MARHGLRERRGDESDAVRARHLREALEELGPTFAKLGQVLSTRPDLLPPEYVAELSALQDQVPPLAEHEVVEVMEEELGVPWEDVFVKIDPEPIAAGTIGQVHRAQLEGGERVVVKVQRPTAQDEILRDVALLELFAEQVAERDVFRTVVDIPAVVEHLSSSLRRELDFCIEARNIERLREVLGPYSRLDVPRVYDAYTSSRLLVMEEIQGVPLREAPPGREREEAARQLIEAYYHQILTDGFFHADPHPGNLLWWQERIYFLDLGMVGEVPPEVRELVMLLLLAFWQEDVPFLADVVLMLGGATTTPDDPEAFERELGDLLGTYRHTALSDIQLGPVIQQVTEISARHGVRLPGVDGADREGARADAARRLRARPDARPAVGRRLVPAPAADDAGARSGGPEAPVLRRPEAPRPRVAARRRRRAGRRRAAGRAAHGELPRAGAGADDPARRPAGRACIRGRRHVDRDRRNGGQRPDRRVGAASARHLRGRRDGVALRGSLAHPTAKNPARFA